MKEEQHFKIKEECERIIKLLYECENFDNFDCKITTEPFSK